MKCDFCGEPAVYCDSDHAVCGNCEYIPPLESTRGFTRVDERDMGFVKCKDYESKTEDS